MSASSRKKPIFIYLLLSLLCAVFSQVYLYFSHGVTSPYMQFLCLIPFFLGFVPALALYFSRFTPGALSLVFYRCAVATLTLGSLTRGILDIYGTTSRLLSVYPVLSVILLCLTGVTCTRRAA